MVKCSNTESLSLHELKQQWKEESAVPFMNELMDSSKRCVRVQKRWLRLVVRSCSVRLIAPLAAQLSCVCVLV